MEELLFEDLKTELSITDKNFNEVLLRSKVRNVVREIKMARKYPTTYTDDMIENDILVFYSNARELVLFDYTHVGAYSETSHTEGETTRSWVDRDKLFNGINAIAKI